MKTLKVITFDVTGTILGLRQTVGYQYSNVALKYGINASADRLSESFKIVFNNLLVEHPNFGENSVGWKSWWKELVLRVFNKAIQEKKPLKPEVVEAISSHLIELYKTNECWKVMEGAVELLQKLCSKKKCLGIISNYDPRLDEILSNLKINNYFDFVLTSYNVKFTKPSLGIFKAVEEMNLNAQKNEILHIGDNPELDFIGAKNAGWNALLVSKEPKKVLEKYPEIDQNWIVGNVNEVYNILSLKKLL